MNSVLGPLDTRDFGFTLGHEHIILASSGITQNYPELLGAGFVDSVVGKLVEAKLEGIRTVVDATTLDLGRDVNRLAEISRRSGVNIIATSGMWCDPPRYFTDFSPDRLAAVFVREIREGITGTNIKAGILKGASDRKGVLPGEIVILRAIARASLQTNVPIMLHSVPALELGRQQLAVLKEEGINLRRVRVDHCSETDNVGYLSWLLDQGCYIGFDRNVNVDAATKVKTLKALLDAGYADRICVSHDVSGVSMWYEAVPDVKQRVLARTPHGFLNNTRVLFPALRELGVSQTVIDQISVTAHRSFFEGV